MVMSIIKKYYKTALLAAAIILPLAGIGTVKAIQMLKADEIQMKQQMKPEVPTGQRAVDFIGIYPPGFDTDLAKTTADYEKEYGKGNFQIISYKGYTLLVPPSKTGKELNNAREDVDNQISSAQSDTPSAELQATQIAKIREVFGTTGNIAYNSFMGAYTDEKGFQYNFYKGQLMGKQVGVTNALADKFNSTYPHFKEGIVPEGSVALTQAQARVKADAAIDKAFGPERASSLKAKVAFTPLSGPRLGITYGDNEVQVLIDTVTGDIIHYSRNK